MARRGLLATLGDDYTVFLDPPQQEAVHEQMSGDFEGIGVYLENDRGRSIISARSPMPRPTRPGQTARRDRARRRARSQRANPRTDIQKQLRGTAGTVVKLTIRREGTPDVFDVDITREVINIPSVQLRFSKTTSP